MVPNQDQNERCFDKGEGSIHLDKIGENADISAINNNSTSSKTDDKQMQSRNIFNKGLDTKELNNVITDLAEVDQNQSLKELLVVQKAEMKHRHNSMPELEGLPQDQGQYTASAAKLMRKKLAR
jgi:hypothetical protein